MLKDRLKRCLDMALAGLSAMPRDSPRYTEAIDLWKTGMFFDEDVLSEGSDHYDLRSAKAQAAKRRALTERIGGPLSK